VAFQPPLRRFASILGYARKVRACMLTSKTASAASLVSTQAG
jgi:hypothetical protein